MSAAATPHPSASSASYGAHRTEIARWRETFPVLLFAPDEDIARLIAAVKAKLAPLEEAR